MSPHLGSLFLVGGAMVFFGMAAFVRHWRRRRTWKRTTGVVIRLLAYGGKAVDARVQYYAEGSDKPQIVHIHPAPAGYPEGSNMALLYDPDAKNRAVRVGYAWTVWLTATGIALIALGVYAAMRGR